MYVPGYRDAWMLILDAALRQKSSTVIFVDYLSWYYSREESIAGPHAEDNKESAQGEEAPETYKEAMKDLAWHKPMINEIRALRNRNYWRVVQTIRSEAYKIEIRLQTEDRLIRQSHQKKVKTRGPRLPSTKRSWLWRDLCTREKGCNILPWRR